MINILVKVKNVMNKILSAASVVLLVFMTSLVLWQVFTRYVLGKPAAFTEELVKLLTYVDSLYRCCICFLYKRPYWFTHYY